MASFGSELLLWPEGFAYLFALRISIRSVEIFFDCALRQKSERGARLGVRFYIGQEFLAFQIGDLRLQIRVSLGELFKRLALLGRQAFCISQPCLSLLDYMEHSDNGGRLLSVEIPTFHAVLTSRVAGGHDRRPLPNPFLSS